MSAKTIAITPCGLPGTHPPIRLAAGTAVFELVELSRPDGPLAEPAGAGNAFDRHFAACGAACLCCITCEIGSGVAV